MIQRKCNPDICVPFLHHLLWFRSRRKSQFDRDVVRSSQNEDGKWVKQTSWVTPFGKWSFLLLLMSCRVSGVTHSCSIKMFIAWVRVGFGFRLGTTPPWTPLYEALRKERGFNEYIHYTRFPTDLSGHLFWADFQNKYKVSISLSGSRSPESIKFCFSGLRMVLSDLCLYKDALIVSVLFTSSTYIVFTATLWKFRDQVSLLSLPPWILSLKDLLDFKKKHFYCLCN